MSEPRNDFNAGKAVLLTELSVSDTLPMINDGDDAGEDVNIDIDNPMMPRPNGGDLDDDEDSGVDANLERSLFDDGSDFGTPAAKRKLFSFIVELENPQTKKEKMRGDRPTKILFYCNELPRTMQKEILAETRAVQREAKRLDRMQKESDRLKRAVEKELMDEDKAQEEIDRIEDELIGATDALSEQSLILNRRVCVASVVDWENPAWPNKMPCTKENRAKLRSTVLAELGDEILSRSFSGRGARRFLAKS